MSVFETIGNWYESIQMNRWDGAQIEALQQQRLRALLRHAVMYSEFYRELYQGLDIDKCRLRDLPTVTKSAMMDNYDRLVTDPRLKLAEIQGWLSQDNKIGKLYLDEFAPFLTAGSTGENALVVYHHKALRQLLATIQARMPLDREISVSHQIRTAVSHLAGTKARLAVMATRGGNFEAISRYTLPLQRLGLNRKIISVTEPIDRIVEKLNDFQPDRILSYSFFLALLAQEQLAGRLNIELNHPMSFVAGTAEPLTEHTQSLAMKAWNKRIQDCYGATECWFMATTCRKSGRLHVMNDLYILEVMDRDGKTVSDGRIGEKVLATNLYNFVQPIIRYEIEDVTGYAGQRCDCGLPFPILTSVKGRTTDFFYFKKNNGSYEIFHPYRLVPPLIKMFELRQYQFVQTARNELTFFYVTQDPEFDDENRLIRKLTDILTMDGVESHVTFKLRRVEFISRDEVSGKFKPFISLGAPTGMNA